VDEAIVELLEVGNWQSALKLLEPQERQLWEQRQSIERRRGGRTTTIMGLTRLRQTLEISLTDLPAAQRWDIAQQLIAADTEL